LSSLEVLTTALKLQLLDGNANLSCIDTALTSLLKRSRFV
jgi:hypothetical protein